MKSNSVNDMWELLWFVLKINLSWEIRLCWIILWWYFKIWCSVFTKTYAFIL